MSRILTPLQQAILFRINSLERVSEDRLRSYLALHFSDLSADEGEWETEFRMATDLLVLYGAIHIEESGKMGRLYLSMERLTAVAAPGPQQEPNAPPRTTSKARYWAMSTATVLAAGCTLLPASMSSKPAPLPYYSDGTSPPSRIEQFSSRGNLVYRYCVDEECPLPTPKIPAQLRVATAPTPKASLPADAVITSTRIQVPTAMMGSALGAAAPVLMASAAPALKEVTTQLKTDNEFTSYKGLVSFTSGAQTLDGLSKQKVAELAPKAREAERVRLRGHVGTSTLNEEMRKLAVGRAYAVKMEFVKHDVQKERIRILYPQKQDVTDSANPSATLNRSVDVMLDMPAAKALSGLPKSSS